MSKFLNKKRKVSEGKPRGNNSQIKRTGINKAKSWKYQKCAIKRQRKSTLKLLPVHDSPKNELLFLSFFANSLTKLLCAQCHLEISQCPKVIIHSSFVQSHSTNICSSKDKNYRCPPGIFNIICINCLVLKLQGTAKENQKGIYHVIDKMSFPLFTRTWSLESELHLLTSIERLGLDNWEDISKQLHNKGKIESEAHYYCFYYKNRKETLPYQSNVIVTSVGNSGEDEYEYEDTILKKNIEMELEVQERVIKEMGKIPEFTNSTNGNGYGGSNRARSLVKNRNKNKKDQNVGTSASEILGYWPKRKEFDIEYLNDAELELSELEFNDYDTPEEIEEKMSILRIYNKELDERVKRKSFVIEKNLFDVKKQIAFERKLSKEDRDIYNVLKPYARVITSEQFHELFEGGVLEKNLKQRLNQLNYYKSLGCKTYDDIQNIIQEENKKNSCKESNKIRALRK